MHIQSLVQEAMDKVIHREYAGKLIEHFIKFVRTGDLKKLTNILTKTIKGIGEKMVK